MKITKLGCRDTKWANAVGKWHWQTSSTQGCHKTSTCKKKKCNNKKCNNGKHNETRYASIRKPERCPPPPTQNGRDVSNGKTLLGHVFTYLMETLSLFCGLVLHFSFFSHLYPGQEKEQTFLLLLLCHIFLLL